MFREDKATQLAAYLIKKAGGRLNYLTLLKMMYDADREMVLRWGTPILFDTWFSMKNDPVLSSTYGRIQSELAVQEFGVVEDADISEVHSNLEPSRNGYLWSDYIQLEDRYNLVLISDPGDSELSDAELAMAEIGFQDFRGLDYDAASKRAHRLFKEWKDPFPAGRQQITFSDLLEANDQNTPENLAEINSNWQLNELLGR